MSTTSITTILYHTFNVEILINSTDSSKNDHSDSQCEMQRHLLWWTHIEITLNSLGNWWTFKHKDPHTTFSRVSERNELFYRPIPMLSLCMWHKENDKINRHFVCYLPIWKWGKSIESTSPCHSEMYCCIALYSMDSFIKLLIWAQRLKDSGLLSLKF